MDVVLIEDIIYVRKKIFQEFSDSFWNQSNQVDQSINQSFQCLLEVETDGIY